MRSVLFVLALGVSQLAAEGPPERTPGLYDVNPDLENFGADPFAPPEFVFELKDLDEARAKARESKRAVTFLLMEPGST